jgi:TRAP-type C4-dicarboxylate transport system permease small subunit
MSYIYLIFPLGGLLMFIESVLSIYRIVLKKEASVSSMADEKGPASA